MRKATGMSMPCERVSFPMDCSAFLSGRHGRWRRRDRLYGRQAQACASMSAPACAACGNKEDGPLCNLYSVTKAGCLIAAGGHYRTLMLIGLLDMKDRVDMKERVEL